MCSFSQTYMKSLLNPIFSKTNFIQPKNIGNTYLEALVQKWSCYFGNTDCLATCQNLVPILLERDFPNDLYNNYYYLHFMIKIR